MGRPPHLALRADALRGACTASGMTGYPGTIAAGAAAPALAAVGGRVKQTAAGRGADGEAGLASEKLVDCRSRHLCSEVGVGVVVGVFDDHDAFGGENWVGRCCGAEGVDAAPGRPGQRATLGVGTQDGRRSARSARTSWSRPAAASTNAIPPRSAAIHTSSCWSEVSRSISPRVDDDCVGQIDRRREGQPRKGFIDHLMYLSTCVVSNRCVRSLITFLAHPLAKEAAR